MNLNTNIMDLNRSSTVPLDLEQTKTDQHTEFLFILDASGSMNSMKEAAVNHLNECIQTAHESAEGSSSASLVVFNNRVTPMFWNRPLDQIQEITVDQYHPSGSTAMYDAIGAAVMHCEQKYANRQNVSFLFNVVTDGQENSSEYFDASVIKKIITRRQNRGNWTFTFAGANIDVHNLVQRLNIPAGNSMAFEATEEGLFGLSKQTSTGIRSYNSARARGQTATNNLYADGATSTTSN